GDWSVTGVQTCALPIAPGDIIQQRRSGDRQLRRRLGRPGGGTGAGFTGCVVARKGPGGFGILAEDDETAGLRVARACALGEEQGVGRASWRERGEGERE